MVWNDAKDPYRLSKHAQPIYMPNLANRWNESWSKLLCGGANASKPSRIPDRLVAEPEFQVVREPSRNDLRALGILQGFDLKLLYFFSSHLVAMFNNFHLQGPKPDASPRPGGLGEFSKVSAGLWDFSLVRFTEIEVQIWTGRSLSIFQRVFPCFPSCANWISCSNTAI